MNVWHLTLNIAGNRADQAVLCGDPAQGGDR